MRSQSKSSLNLFVCIDGVPVFRAGAAAAAASSVDGGRDATDCICHCRIVIYFIIDACRYSDNPPISRQGGHTRPEVCVSSVLCCLSSHSGLQV